MDNVQIYNCSQRDTDKAALRWQAAFNGHSRVTNSAIHHGEAWGVFIDSSKNIEFDNNVVVGFKPIGFNIVNVQENIVVTNNIIGDVRHRASFGTGEHVEDREGCLLLCSYPDPMGCNGMTITNNKIGGCSYVGYTSPSHDCDNPSGTGHTISGNVAHSIDRNGVIVFPDPSRS